MFNPRAFLNTRADGFGVLELPDEAGPGRRFVPLRRTDLAGTVTGPLAALRLTQTFALDGPADRSVEALYRFPLPGDAAVTGVTVRFGAVEISTALKPRAEAEKEYADAKRAGQQAALVIRESPDVFTLAVAGVRPGEDVVVETQYVQLARAEAGGWGLRVPLTTAPRYVRGDEEGSRSAAGQPLAVLRDPGHRFALDLVVRGADRVDSPTHRLAAAPDGDGVRVRLADGEVVPDRDLVLGWRPPAAARVGLGVWWEPGTGGEPGHFLALATGPAVPAAAAVPREVVILVDHSGSMAGAKWEAADWAVERFLAGLSERDVFALGLFHDSTRWFAKEPRAATPEAVRQAVAFLHKHTDQGGTELGVALEQALGLPRPEGFAARHVLVVTDAQVSDAGRLLRMADAEAGRGDRRRLSVLCIDAAPNTGLADELAGRGGGVARYLTSDPAEDDVTTALDEVMGEWAAPAHAGMTLEVDRPGVEAAGRSVTLVVPGPGSAVDLGDPPAGRPVWVVGRVAGDGPPRFRLRAGGGETVADCPEPPTAAVPGVKALFGADRLRRLEYLVTGHLSPAVIAAEVARLGLDAPTSVYPENDAAAAAKAVRGLMARESLACGLPCSETAFVAVRAEGGKPVTETAVVANALPAGWEGQFFGVGYGGGAGGAGGYAGAPVRMRAGLSRFAPAPPRPGGPGRVIGAAAKLTGDMLQRLRDASARASKPTAAPAAPPAADLDADDDAADFDTFERAAPPPAPPGLQITVPAGRHPRADGAVLFDAATDPGLPDRCRLTGVTLSAAGSAAAVDPGLMLLVFVGDAATPRARVKLADLLRPGGRRPLNLRRSPGEVVRLVLADPAGAWAGGVPGLVVGLTWE